MLQLMDMPKSSCCLLEQLSRQQSTVITSSSSFVFDPCGRRGSESKAFFPKNPESVELCYVGAGFSRGGKLAIKQAELRGTEHVNFNLFLRACGEILSQYHVIPSCVDDHLAPPNRWLSNF